jgi:putative peptidoglycan lipid II flippase
VHEPEVASHRRIGAAALLLVASNLISRVLGYGREVLLAYLFGAGASTDAYYAAFIIPDFLNYLLAGGALSIAFLPQYTRMRAEGDEAGAERFLGVTFGTIGALAMLLTLGIWLSADPLVDRVFAEFDPPTRELTVRLTRIVLPAQIFFVTGGILNATLFARGRFGAAAAAPAIYNLCIIAGGAALGPVLGIEGFAWGVLLGAILGPFGAPWLDSRRRVRLRPRVAPTEPAFRTYLVRALPLMLGQSLLTVDDFFEKIFAPALGRGAVAYLGYARRLMLVPVAIVGQAVSTAMLPALAQLWAEGKKEELNRVVTDTLQAALAAAALCGGAFVVFAEPIVAVLLQWGAFKAADTAAVATLLAVLAFAVPAWVTQQIAVRAFYARADTWRPMLLGTAVVALVIPLYLLMRERYGIAGLAWAGVIGMSVNALATLTMARRLHDAPRLGRLAVGFARTLAITVGAAWVARLVADWSGASFDTKLAHALAQLVVGGGVYGALTLTGVLGLGDEPSKRVVQRVVNKLRRKR